MFYKLTTKIYVGNLPENADSEELQAQFAKYGEVKECDVVRNYAFVHMSSEDDAKTAVENLNDSEFMGTKISVEMSHSKVRQKPGMGGKGQCYRCGKQGHWSKECPRNPAMRMGNPGGPPMGYPGSGGYGPGVGGYGPGGSGYGGPGASGYGPGASGYGGERFPRFGMDRPFGAERSFGERMRPYPDPYERRPPPLMSAPSQDSYVYYRRPYETTYGYTRRSPPPTQMQSSANRYDFTQDPTFSSGQLSPTTRRAPVY